LLLLRNADDLPSLRVAGSTPIHADWGQNWGQKFRQSQTFHYVVNGERPHFAVRSRTPVQC
jgi:hypothetical protein